MENFDPYDFENMLQEDFFCGNDLDEIKHAIKSRLKAIQFLQGNMNHGYPKVPIIHGSNFIKK
jgi:hypothetical protein